MAEALPRVLSIPRSDLKGDQFALLHVESTGKHPLDLKLVGTDGGSVFSVSLKHNQTSSWKDKRFAGSSEQWDQILSAVLLGTRQTEAEGVEVAARLEDGGAELTITIQKRIEQITQKLGAITLVEKEEVVELYDWCGLTIKSRETATLELEELKSQLKAKEEEASKLNTELAEMVKLKNDSENNLIEKFSLLLNEKKLKIRDQQRLLASASIDPAKLEAVEQSRSPGQSGSAGPSQARKRKAAQRQKDETDSDEGFEKMDVDIQQSPTDSEDDQPQTPEQSTADEASEDEAPIPPTRETANTRAAGKATTGEPEPEPLPPKRDLPFSKKSPSKQAPPPKTAATGESDTESDNDEL